MYTFLSVLLRNFLCSLVEFVDAALCAVDRISCSTLLVFGNKFGVLCRIWLYAHACMHTQKITCIRLAWLKCDIRHSRAIITYVELAVNGYRKCYSPDTLHILVLIVLLMKTMKVLINTVHGTRESYAIRWHGQKYGFNIWLVHLRSTYFSRLRCFLFYTLKYRLNFNRTSKLN